jgi:thiosulfate/3-mercaptopyruvate sulfurtransferase
MELTQVLDGSIADWKAAGGPVDEAPASTFYAKDLIPIQEGTLYHAVEPLQVVNRDRVLKVVRSFQSGAPSNTIIIDARSKERFYAQAPEPREGLRRGHMPGAKNVFFASLLQAENLNRLKSRQEMQQQFAQAGIPLDDKSVNFITTCGSGATACTLAAAMLECGVERERIAIYDGSWMEWGAYDTSPIVTIDD